MSSTDFNVPEVATLVQAARNIVFSAREKDQLGSLTVKSVRKQVERDFSLHEGALDLGEIKIILRNAVNTAVAEEIVVNTTKRKRSPDDSDDQEVVSAKNAPKKVQRSKGNGKGASDEEEKSGHGPKRKKTSRMAKKSKKTIKSDSDDLEEAPTLERTASTSKTIQDVKKTTVPAESKPTRLSSDKKCIEAAPSVDVEKSESELSVLIDGPPKKKRAKGKAKEAPKKATKPKKEKEPAKALDKDEETIKRLKSYVSACGLRKPWSKEFADLPLPKQQITRLKEILADLGMTGRYTMEQAKVIKEQRALAQELNDVLEYERKAGASRASRSRSQANTKRPVGELDTDSEVQESSEHEEQEDPESPVVKRKKNTASRSIMAYLENQSSDEE